jgi:hypothetical protein
MEGAAQQLAHNLATVSQMGAKMRAEGLRCNRTTRRRTEEHDVATHQPAGQYPAGAQLLAEADRVPTSRAGQ